ncbi:hypothetical protein ACT453_41795, partial [Bacillus sp. D-CC]
SFILGISSATPALIGNSGALSWQKRHQCTFLHYEQATLQVAILWDASAQQKNLILGLLQMEPMKPIIISVQSGCMSYDSERTYWRFPKLSVL